MLVFKNKRLSFVTLPFTPGLVMSTTGPGFRPTVVAVTEAVDKSSAVSLLERYFDTSLNTVLF